MTETLTTPTAPPPTGHIFSAAEAAAACGRSKKTILRKVEALAAAGATKDERGEWRITAAQLIAVGLHPNRYEPHDPMAVLDDEDDESPASRVVSPLEEALLAEQRSLLAAQRHRIAELEQALRESEEDRNHWKTQHAIAEAIAEERALTMNDIRRDRQLLVEQMRPRGFLRRKQITAGPAH